MFLGKIIQHHKDLVLLEMLYKSNAISIKISIEK